MPKIKCWSTNLVEHFKDGCCYVISFSDAMFPWAASYASWAKNSSINSHAGEWSRWRPKAVKSILWETVSLKRHILSYYPQFHFNIIYTNENFWKTVRCLEKILFSKTDFQFFTKCWKINFEKSSCSFSSKWALIQSSNRALWYDKGNVFLYF